MLFGQTDLVRCRLIGVDREISIVNFLGMHCRQRREKKSESSKPGAVHNITDLLSKDIRMTQFNKDGSVKAGWAGEAAAARGFSTRLNRAHVTSLKSDFGEELMEQTSFMV